MRNNNIILMSDSYKATHFLQYPKDTEKVYSYLEARKREDKFPETVFFGLQYYLKEYLQGCRVTNSEIQEGEDLFTKHLGDKNLFNRAGWERIRQKHAGYLPVSIKAVPEGTVVPRGNVLMTIENTDPQCYWLTNYLETLLVQTWYASTIGTRSRMSRNIILKWLEKTGDPSLIDFKLHDFGYRGVSSVETAGVGGCAHLISFKGTDTVAGLVVARDYYNCEMAGFSIPAAEHSTIISWGKEHEGDAYENMLDKFPGMVAVVSDSYDLGNACRELWGKRLKEKVLKHGGTVVVRPDSGIPVESVLNSLCDLGNAFGYEFNSKGYKVLNPKIRIIQGDGINMDSMEHILIAAAAARWSADNFAFGSGGALLQKDVDRDTMAFAFKCSSVVVNGEKRDVFKQPIGDSGKNSKAGRLKLIKDGLGNFKTVSDTAEGEDNLVEVFKDGKILVDHNFDDIRARCL